MTFLAIDVGNTRLKWALYESAQPHAAMLASGVKFLEHIETLAEDDWADLPAPATMLGCIVAGDAVKRRVQEQMDMWHVEPRWVVPGDSEAGVTNGYDHPTRLGADRWVAMIGAYQRMLASGKPQPCVVVMVGTAVTIESIDASGQFLGGVILPGHGIMLRALESGTAGLHVPTGEVVSFPTNTSDALTTGGTFAIAGAVAHVVNLVQVQCGQPAVCYMTGGAGWKMAPSMSVPVQLVDGLIFDGLLEIAHRRGLSSAANTRA